MLALHSYRLVNEEEFLYFYQQIKIKLPPYLLEKIESFKFMADKQRSLIGHLIVLRFYSKLLNINWKEILFDYNEHDKPSIKGRENHFFNISHSGNQVVAAFSDHNIGIDVEKIKGDRRKIANRFFTSSEIADMKAIENEDEQVKYFYQLWTLKESYMKAIGKGMTLSLSSFAFKKEQDEFKLAFSKEGMNWHFYSPKWEEGYYLSLCCKNKEKIKKSEILLNDLKLFFL